MVYLFFWAVMLFVFFLSSRFACFLGVGGLNRIFFVFSSPLNTIFVPSGRLVKDWSSFEFLSTLYASGVSIFFQLILILS